MINTKNFKPHHINATCADFTGNEENGRYIFVPGSHARAQEIAEKYFTDLKINKSERGHDLYLGNLKHNGQTIEVASISTGMGTPSVDIIVSELILLGARNFLRVGTAGSLQPHVKIGDIVFATSAVRDEGTGTHYVPLEFPAVCSTDFLFVAEKLRKLKIHSTSQAHTTHFGMVHSKDSLYAREFLCGPNAQENKRFIEKMREYGVLASEMECSHLYVLSSYYSQYFQYNIKSCGLLAIIGGTDVPFQGDTGLAKKTIANTIELAIQLVQKMASTDA